MDRLRGLLATLSACLAIGVTEASPPVLNGTSHADGSIGAAIFATAGGGVIDSSVFVDFDPAQSSSLWALLIPAATNASGSYTSVASNTTVNHQPYGVLNLSYSGYNIGVDYTAYPNLVTIPAVLAYAPAVLTNGQQPAGTPPPVALTGASSRESQGTGWGVEFAIENTSCASPCTNVGGFSLTTDSAISAELAGFYAALKYEHPTWTWFDIKGALRQTSANWPTYDHTNFGYGTINWPSANAVSSTSAIYLQPPGLQITNIGWWARVTVFPFASTRRSQEVVCSLAGGYTPPSPLPNEFTTAQFNAACGTVLYTSAAASTGPQTFAYAPSVSGMITFVAFTTDGAGNYSSYQQFSPQQQMFVEGIACR